ncbi:MAG: CPBP family intramembrane metalloprotease [Gammaproteobacteria bacterium]|nr:CPBP family intramembrane metalloprotease [Gammaproteobacteria bacterium]MBT6246702.1 CPBP family intramembrane metalloprotease [Gammaproteobacteria bacterium]
MSDSDSGLQLPGQRRLQRPPDFTGRQLNDFNQVALRHGLPGLLLGCLLLITSAEVLSGQLSRFLAAPAPYVLGAVAILLFTLFWSWYLDRAVSIAQSGWVLYLLFVSIWEEWAFRVAVPIVLEGTGLDPRVAIIGSNVLFGAMHYFTLRWKATWCFLAFLGGMGLSIRYIENGNLFFLIGIHWIATFLNTPRYPGKRAASGQDFR